MERPVVCLAMIVKNEEHVIARACESAAPHITTYCICDTGSTDNTKSIIKETFDKLGIQGVILDKEWTDHFGDSRTEMLAEARIHTNRRGVSWVLDADDSLEGEPVPDNWWSASHSAYYINLRLYNLSYKRIQVFNNSVDWVYKGSRHEYPDCPDDTLPIGYMPNTITNIARSEGSRSQDPLKWYRDANSILTKDIPSDPKDPRTVFYLAQSFRCAGALKEARKWYKKRVKLSGNYQEKYLAYTELIQYTDKMRKKIKLCWAAIEVDNTRLEAPYNVIDYARRMNIFTKELYWLGAYIKNRIPMDHMMCADIDVYNWRYDDVLSIHAYYTGHKTEFKEYIKEALKKCPDDSKGRLEANLKYE